MDLRNEIRAMGNRRGRRNVFPTEMWTRSLTWAIVLSKWRVFVGEALFSTAIHREPVVNDSVECKKENE